MPDYAIYGLIFVTGLVAGFINTIAGGGSALIYPLLIFAGLSPHQAIGTARPAFLMQGLAAWLGFKSKKIHLFPFNLYVAIAAAAGSTIGARLSLAVPPEMLKKIIALVIAGVTLYVLLAKPVSPRPGQSVIPSGKRLWLNILVFFLLGIYSGFIQTGLGYMIIIALMLLNGMNLTQANSIKALVILVSGIPSLLIFAKAGMVKWLEALILAAGMALGSWITSRWSVEADEKKVKRITGALALLMALKLWWS